MYLLNLGVKGLKDEKLEALVYVFNTNRKSKHFGRESASYSKQTGKRVAP